MLHGYKLHFKRSWKSVHHAGGGRHSYVTACKTCRRVNQVPSSLHPKTQMCSSSAFHSLLIFLVRCTLSVVPKQRENRRCAEDSVPLLLVTILAVHFLEYIPSQAVTLLVLLEEKEKLVPWLNLMQKNKKYQDAFTQLGKEWLVPRDLFDVLQEFTCKLYVNRCPIMTVNTLSAVPAKERRGQIWSTASLWRLPVHV